jgi:hypothetical protein
MIANQIAGLMGVSAPVSLTDYESIQTYTVGAGGQAAIEFTGISGSYKHLQIRGIARSAKTASLDNLRIQFNSNTGTNYASHELYGTGSGSGLAYAEPSTTSSFIDGIASDFNSANIFGVFVMDVLDYASTNKNKTVRTLSGTDANGSGTISLNSGLFYATPAAITSIKIYFGSFNLKQYSTIALYGIK